jgi:pterin-4a-carbinolamine dehydratase
MPAEASPPPFVFISYRRQDSAAAARWMYSSLQRTFGTDSVFMDTESIRMSDEWSDRIEEALKRATLLIAVIGPQWLRIADEFGRRRIDREDDWVRNEIARGLDSRVRLMPVLLSRTPLPEREALPPPLQRLVQRQAFELRDDRWEQDLNALIAGLESLGFKRRSEKPIRYPKPKVTIAELSRDELDEALRGLSKWQRVVSEIPGKEPLKRTELKRTYEFRSFVEAIAFMADAAPHIDRVEHHPRWENLWRTVTVWLTTWDIGHLPSRLDVDLAKYLDAQFDARQSA